MPGFPLERRQPSFDLAELVGRKTEDAKARCERDGFQVELLDQHSKVTLELNPNRIRLTVRRGLVEDCHQG
ncbi:hypothetical protein ACWEF6_24850 [Amycolatopsis sp. NPDC004772]